MTQIEAARKGIITAEMKSAAAREGVEAEFIRAGIEEGVIVINRNRLHTAISGLAVGRGLKTKVNANIGSSQDMVDVEIELQKLRAAINAGAEAVMDLSTGGDVAAIRKEGRIMGIVSRGGALTAEWMKFNKKENPLYEDYDRLVKIAKKYDMVLSLGDGLRPGCLADATDRGQVSELIILGELAKRAFEAGGQVMIEGPG